MYIILFLFSFRTAFISHNYYLLLEIVLNSIMMIPFGVWMGCIFNKTVQCVLVDSILFELTIEMVQLVYKNGVFEFDDIIFGCCEAIIGYYGSTITRAIFDRCLKGK